jgi:hypothetical protein
MLRKFKLVLAVLFLLAPFMAQAATDPLPIFTFANDTSKIIYQPNTTDAAVGSYAFSTSQLPATQLTGDTASFNLIAVASGNWTYGGTLYPQPSGTTVNVSGYTYINVDIYGDNSGKTLYLDFEDNSGDAAYFQPTINWSGWQHLSFALTSASAGGGTPANTWTAIAGLSVWANTGGPMNVYVANLAATNTAPVIPDHSVVAQAANRTITVDGTASSWDLTASQPISVDTSALTTASLTMSSNIRAVWDANYLYILVQEGGSAQYALEAPTAAAYQAAPYNFDGVALYLELNQTNYGATSTILWMGFNSSGLPGVWTSTINNTTSPYVQSDLANGAVTTSGKFAQHNRVIEAKLAWSDLAALNAAYLPTGGLNSSTIVPGLKIGCQPLIVDNNYNIQAFIGGTQWAPPSGYDTNSRTIQLSSTIPVTLSTFSFE